MTTLLSEGGHLPTGAVEAIGFGQSFEADASLLIRLELTYTSAAPRSAPSLRVGEWAIGRVGETT